MTQKISSKDDGIDVKEPEENLKVSIEGESDAGNDSPAEPKKEDLPRQEDDVQALKTQLDSLKKAQEVAAYRAKEAERQADAMAQQLNGFRQSAEQSQYDTIVTAMGAAQMEIDAAKRDIMLAMAAQDGQTLADAQERLASAKAHMINLEHGKNTYESQRANGGQVQQDPMSVIDNNPNLMYSEKAWLREHPDVLINERKRAKLDALYYDALDAGLSRGSPEYFIFMEEGLGYREKKVMEHKEDRPSARQEQEQDNSIMVAAPPSRSVPSGSGSGGGKGTYTMTREEAEIAKVSGISPAEYVRQREKLKKLKRANPDDYPSQY